MSCSRSDATCTTPELCKQVGCWRRAPAQPLVLGMAPVGGAPRGVAREIPLLTEADVRRIVREELEAQHGSR
jgi:hypothetical protein